MILFRLRVLGLSSESFDSLELETLFILKENLESDLKNYVSNFYYHKPMMTMQ